MSGNIVFDVENFRGNSIEDASRTFIEWTKKHPARKQGRWGVPLNRITLRVLAVHNQGLPSNCLLYTSPSPRDATLSRMPSSA